MARRRRGRYRPAEVAPVAGRSGARRDVATPPKLRERQARVDLTPLIAQLVEVSVGEDAPVEWIAGRDLLDVVPDHRRAVVGQRVVPHGRLREPVDLAQIVEEQRARERGCALDAIEVQRLLPRTGPDADDVALVGDDVVQLELTEEAEQRRILLALLLAGLDRDRQVLPVGELPARDRVGDATGAPGGDEHIEADDLVEIERALLPALDDGPRRGISKVPEVADHDAVAVDLRARQPGDVGLPVPRVAGRKREPPAEHDRERDEGRRRAPPPRPDEEEQQQRRARHHDAERRGQDAALRAVDPDRRHAPRDDDGDHRIESHAKRAADQSAHLAATCSRRIRRTSRMVSGSPWHECGARTTFSDSTPSRWALS